MFTGLVETVGTVTKLAKGNKLATLTVRAPKIARSAKIGDSICVNGACLTVTKKTAQDVTFEMMLETLRVTTLGTLKPKSKVNLERALKANDRLGGHFVTGHVDAITKISKIVKDEDWVEFQLNIPKGFAKHLVAKGSVTLDGISLTVGKVGKKHFSVYLIPHTLKVTTLGAKKVGSQINFESDLLAKYVLCRDRF